MRLEKIQEFLRRQEWPFEYEEENDSGSIEFVHRGLAYHIWEYPEPERGAASNVVSAGRMVDYEGDYEEQILKILQGWDGTK